MDVGAGSWWRARNEVTAVQVQILKPRVGVEARSAKVVYVCFGPKRVRKRGHRGLSMGGGLRKMAAGLP